MNEFNSFTWQMAMAQEQRPLDTWNNRSNRVVLTARRLYEKAQWRGRLARLAAWLRQRPYHPLDLATVEQQCQITNRYHAGMQTVPLAQIRGSDGRSHDFDAAFHPNGNHNREQWLRVAAARLAGDPLPPVELIQVGGVYFVRDGHHRISVARSMGQKTIDAEVTVWQAANALPWEQVKQEKAAGAVKAPAA